LGLFVQLATVERIKGETMYFNGQIANDIYKIEEPLTLKRAQRAWRFRHLKSKETKIATAILTSVLNLFIR
jgi:hypothetical protein